MNDGDLVRAVQRGDRASLATLYQRYLGSVWRYVHARLPRDSAAAEDLVSETFLAAIQSIRTYDAARGNVFGWLLGIARNKLGDHLRRNARQREGDAVRIDVATARANGAVTAEADLIQVETRDAVLRALDALADEERLVLEWKYVESLSVREIAERIARTEKAVEAILYRARMSFHTAFAREQVRS
jgi:RNA polymerase sigma-70 factor, ECF subfamily